MSYEPDLMIYNFCREYVRVYDIYNMLFDLELEDSEYNMLILEKLKNVESTLLELIWINFNDNELIDEDIFED